MLSKKEFRKIMQEAERRFNKLPLLPMKGIRTRPAGGWSDTTQAAYLDGKEIGYLHSIHENPAKGAMEKSKIVNNLAAHIIINKLGLDKIAVPKILGKIPFDPKAPAYPTQVLVEAIPRTSTVTISQLGMAAGQFIIAGMLNAPRHIIPVKTAEGARFYMIDLGTKTRHFRWSHTQKREQAAEQEMRFLTELLLHHAPTALKNQNLKNEFFGAAARVLQARKHPTKVVELIRRELPRKQAAKPQRKRIKRPRRFGK